MRAKNVGEINPRCQFINILRAAFARVKPKSIKKTVKSTVFLCFQDLRGQKLLVNILVKSTPGGNWLGGTSGFHNYIT